jgi:small basic protein
MKLPVIGTALGLLFGIVLYFALQPYLSTAVGAALLFIICILVANCAAWAAQALFGKGK